MTGQAPDIQLPWDLHYGEANSPWEVRQRIPPTCPRRRGPASKSFLPGAVLTHGSNPNSLEFTPEELNAAVDEASHFGLRVAVHAHAAQGIKNAILAGAASIEHAEIVDDEGIALAIKHGTYFRHGHLRRRVHPGGREEVELHPKTFWSMTPSLANCSEKLPQGCESWCEDGVLERTPACARTAPAAKQFAFMVKYGMSPMHSHPGSDDERRRSPWAFQRSWVNQAGQVRGSHRSFG